MSLWTYYKAFEPPRLGSRHFVETDKTVGEQAESNLMVKKMGGRTFIIIALKSIRYALGIPHEQIKQRCLNVTFPIVMSGGNLA